MYFVFCVSRCLRISVCLSLNVCLVYVQAPVPPSIMCAPLHVSALVLLSALFFETMSYWTVELCTWVEGLTGKPRAFLCTSAALGSR